MLFMHLLAASGGFFCTCGLTLNTTYSVYGFNLHLPTTTAQLWRSEALWNFPATFFFGLYGRNTLDTVCVAFGDFTMKSYVLCKVSHYLGSIFAISFLIYAHRGNNLKQSNFVIMFVSFFTNRVWGRNSLRSRFN